MYKRHLLFYGFFRPLAGLFVKIRFGYQYKKYHDLPEKFIVLSNHTTDYDPVFVGVSFPQQMYFVASEHIARWPLAYKFLKYGFAPIIRYKGTTATSTVMEMLRLVKDGKRVCMFAEGNRSWDGVTAAVAPATGKVIKSAKCALITYRLQGGYFVSPRWSKTLRRGKVAGNLVNVYTAEQIAAMSVKEINEIIARDLYEDAYARQQEAPVPYKGKNLAEGMENLLFICPKCGAVDSMHSKEDTVSCSKCDFGFRYTEFGMLEGAPYDTITEFTAWQKQEVEKAAEKGTIYTAPEGDLVTILKSVETQVAQGKVELSGEMLSCGDYQIPVQDILDMEMHGKRALVFSTKDAYYELKPSEKVSAYKFYRLFKAYKLKAEKN